MEEDLRTVWCGNLSEKVTEEILYELFLQAGPVDKVFLPKNYDGRPRSYAFIKYEHECSAPYAVALFHNTSLFGKKLILNSRNKDIKMPKVLKNLINANKQDNREPASWKELKHAKKSDSCNADAHVHNIPLQLPPQIADFDKLLQMGQQMMLPGIGGFPPVGGFPHIPMSGFHSFPVVTNNCKEEKDRMCYPSQKKDELFGGHRKSYETETVIAVSVRNSHRSDERDNHHSNERGNHRTSEKDNRYHERDRKNRNSTRPYDLADHRSRDRKYASSHTLGHRERR